MSLRRILNCGSLLYSKFHKSLPFFPAFSVKSATLGQFSFLSSFCSSNRSLECCKINFNLYSPLIIPSRGMKTKGKLQLRCKNCYYVRKDGEMYVKCSSYPRHTQKLKTGKPKNFWILTHACQSRQKPHWCS